MKYKRQELVEVTEPQIFDPPKKMLVWDCDRTYTTDDIPNLCKPKVIAILPKVFANKIVLAINYDNTYSCYAHCAEIPEETKPRWATNRELAKWLAQGNGELSQGDSPKATTLWVYEICYKDKTVPEFIFVRKWDDTEWHEPTVDYMGLEA